ncbi:unnamed protein product [Periconia digitata]|uniref:Purple acid phosphatase n=1 Tax=Periconia digitata TaxID=1303443 RepID=A0A9W4UNW7_9PLEO|nr:unnamed protein product [Periconia digitata]
MPIMDRLSILFCILQYFSACVFAAVSYPDIPKDPSTPVQQRIAIKGKNSISVAWNTYQKLDKPCVSYGKSPKRLHSTQCSTHSETYPTSRTHFNVVILENLKSGTTYYYKILSTNSTTESFLSPREPGDTTPFSFNAVIDLGVYGKDGFTLDQGSPSHHKRSALATVDPSLNHTTIARLHETIDDYELVLHPGDFGYADDWFLKPKNILHGTNAYSAILESFYNQLSPITSRKPYMASPGNHEATCGEIPALSLLCPEGQRNFTDILIRFGATMPTAFPSSSKSPTAQASAENASSLALPPFWYSFEYGSVHFTMLNTETDFPNAPDQPGGNQHLYAGPFGKTLDQQLKFLEADLASVDRSVTPWLVVSGHRPFYTTSSSSRCGYCQKAFEHLFYKYGVDLGVFGHVHNSQRFNPIYKNVPDENGLEGPKAPLYIVAGGAGSIEGLSKMGKGYGSFEFGYDEDFSFAGIDIKSEEKLGVRFLRSRSGEVLDEVELTKKRDGRFIRQEE